MDQEKLEAMVREAMGAGRSAGFEGRLAEMVKEVMGMEEGYQGPAKEYAGEEDGYDGYDPEEEDEDFDFFFIEEEEGNGIEVTDEEMQSVLSHMPYYLKIALGPGAKKKMRMAIAYFAETVERKQYEPHFTYVRLKISIGGRLYYGEGWAKKLPQDKWDSCLGYSIAYIRASKSIVNQLVKVLEETEYNPFIPTEFKGYLDMVDSLTGLCEFRETNVMVLR